MYDLCEPVSSDDLTGAFFFPHHDPWNTSPRNSRKKCSTLHSCRLKYSHCAIIYQQLKNSAIKQPVQCCILHPALLRLIHAARPCLSLVFLSVNTIIIVWRRVFQNPVLENNALDHLKVSNAQSKIGLVKLETRILLYNIFYLAFLTL